jgi:hypothetical protein
MRSRTATTNDPATDSPPHALWPEKVIGGKYIRALERLLRDLRDDEPHGHRRLFLDDVFVVHRLAFFNPAIRSLRTIEDFSQTAQARRHLSSARLCRSTLSDFHRLADPTRLRPILEQLRCPSERKRAGRRQPEDDLTRLLRKTIAVDGTFLPACAEVAWAVRSANPRRECDSTTQPQASRSRWPIS